MTGDHIKVVALVIKVLYSKAQATHTGLRVRVGSPQLYALTSHYTDTTIYTTLKQMYA